MAYSMQLHDGLISFYYLYTFLVPRDTNWHTDSFAVNELHYFSFLDCPHMGLVQQLNFLKICLNGHKDAVNICSNKAQSVNLFLV